MEINRAIKILGSLRTSDAASFIDTVKRVTKRASPTTTAPPLMGSLKVEDIARSEYLFAWYSIASAMLWELRGDIAVAAKLGVS